MHSAASEEQWTAVRALREGRRPTYLRLQRATGIHLSTIAKRAQRENWRSPDETGGADDDADGASMGDDAFDGAFDADAADGFDAAGLHADPAAGLAGLLRRQAHRMLASAEARGRILDKAQVDTVASMVRLLERSETLAQERADEKNTGDDAELGEILGRIDRRILELAVGAARWMVETGDRRILG